MCVCVDICMYVYIYNPHTCELIIIFLKLFPTLPLQKIKRTTCLSSFDITNDKNFFFSNSTFLI